MPPLRLRAPVAATVLAAATLTASGPQVAFAQASPAPSPSSSPAAQIQNTPEDPAVTAKAKDIMHRVQSGTVDRTQLSDDYNKRVTDATLTSASAELTALGEPQAFTYFGKLTQGDVTAYVYRVRMERGVVDELVAFDPANKIVRLLFRLRAAEPGQSGPATGAPEQGATPGT